jgi:hypothetical protein
MTSTAKTCLVCAVIGLIISVMTGMPQASAQVPPGGITLPQSAGTSNYHFAEPNELTINVSVMGAVLTTGRYEISRTLNLLDLIALAGGWQDYADKDDVIITRYIAPGLSEGRKELRVDLSDLTSLKDGELALENGDIVYVNGSPRSWFDKALVYLTAVGVMITTYLLIRDQL